MKLLNPKSVFLDFEYNKTTEEKLNVVCVAWSVDDGPTQSLWLHRNPKNKQKFKSIAKEWLGKDTILYSYNVVAEARSFYSLGLDPMVYQWCCLYSEYKHIMNQNHRIAFGKQLIQGKKKYTRPPRNKYFMSEEEKQRSSFDKAEQGLAAACYKLLGKEVDTDRKNRVRNLIISTPDFFTKEENFAILEYCESDIEFLAPLKNKIVDELQHLLRKDPKQLETLREEILFRGKYNALTAIRESRGYYFDYESTKSLSGSIPKIVYDIQREINTLFPEIGPFSFLKKDNRFKKNTKNIKEWIAKQRCASNWLKTDSGDYSLALEAWTQHFNFRHTYPKDNFGAQYVRYLKTEMGLKGFNTDTPDKIRTSLENNTRRTRKFWEYVGSDKICRPYMNIYGSQTSRTQPKANGFLALKSAWMRALITPPLGYAMVSMDYKSEEFLISAINALDGKMIEAYESGDQYLWFGKQSGVIPKDGTKKSHPTERQNCKNTVLGISYGMGAKALALKLTNDGDREYFEDEAQDYIDNFFDTFARYDEYRESTLDIYAQKGHIKLQDGWYMWGDNDNDRSTMNFPSQGAGGVAMRYADIRCYNEGLWVPFTLHDALYAYIPLDELEKGIEDMTACLIEGFKDIYRDDPKKLGYASKIRLDTDAWSPEFSDDFKIPGVKVQQTYVDERGVSEYKQFKKYFKTRPGSFL